VALRVAICGAGIAGPTLAYWLQRGGHQPTLIEKAPHLRQGGYLIDFWGVGYEVAQRMGLESMLQEIGYQVRQVRLVDSHGKTSASFSAEVFRRLAQGRYVSLARGDLATAIYDAIVLQVETIFGDSVTAIAEHDHGVRVTFTRSGPREFDLVIGADGLHSTVRELVFGPESQFEKDLGYVVAACEVTGYRPREELVYVSYTTPGKQVARFALRGDRTLFLFIFSSEHLPGPVPHTLAERKQTLRRVFGEAGWECARILDAVDGVPEIYFDRVSQIRMPGWSQGRVMLLGDAASCVSLLAGEGTGLAMTEAYVLAGELHRAQGDYQAAFRQHEQRLRPFITGKQESAERFAASFVPRTRFAIWRRNQATKLLALPPLASIIFARSFRDDFTLPDYGL
jgi:2-polyprenyl-6-methoxyphenol hydroxylase-like FAD-dependent oxidoreductase